MKFLLCALFLFVISCYHATSQKLDSASIHKLSPQKQEEVNTYLLQAKNAKTTGILLCMGGGSLAIAGIVYSFATDASNGYVEDYPSYNGGTKVAILGAMVGLSGIPFFIKAHNKRDAARAMLYTDRGALLTPRVLVPGSQSAGIRLVIPLGRF